MTARRIIFILLPFIMANCTRDRAALMATAIFLSLTGQVGLRVIAVQSVMCTRLPFIMENCTLGREVMSLRLEQTAMFWFLPKGRAGIRRRVLMARRMEFMPLPFLMENYMRVREPMSRVTAIFMNLTGQTGVCFMTALRREFMPLPLIMAIFTPVREKTLAKVIFMNLSHWPFQQ